MMLSVSDASLWPYKVSALCWIFTSHLALECENPINLTQPIGIQRTNRIPVSGEEEKAVTPQRQSSPTAYANAAQRRLSRSRCTPHRRRVLLVRGAHAWVLLRQYKRSLYPNQLIESDTRASQNASLMRLQHALARLRVIFCNTALFLRVDNSIQDAIKNISAPKVFFEMLVVMLWGSSHF